MPPCNNICTPVGIYPQFANRVVNLTSFAFQFNASGRINQLRKAVIFTFSLLTDTIAASIHFFPYDVDI
jgi:hypothetical protein